MSPGHVPNHLTDYGQSKIVTQSRAPFYVLDSWARR